MLDVHVIDEIVQRMIEHAHELNDVRHADEVSSLVDLSTTEASFRQSRQGLLSDLDKNGCAADESQGRKAHERVVAVRVVLEIEIVSRLHTLLQGRCFVFLKNSGL